MYLINIIKLYDAICFILYCNPKCHPNSVNSK